MCRALVGRKSSCHNSEIHMKFKLTAVDDSVVTVLVFGPPKMNNKLRWKWCRVRAPMLTVHVHKTNTKLFKIEKSPVLKPARCMSTSCAFLPGQSGIWGNSCQHLERFSKQRFDERNVQLLSIKLITLGSYQQKTFLLTINQWSPSFPLIFSIMNRIRRVWSLEVTNDIF